MKKLCVCICMIILLSGCAARETFETISDDILQPVMAPAGEILLTLPQSASTQTMLGEDGAKLYFCDGYTATVQTVERGDLEATAKLLCGYGTDSLDIVETAVQGKKRWDWVWTAAGEGGDVIGRAAVIDDGSYHYCVTVMASSKEAGTLEAEWTALFRSFHVG